jgi:hypothetical protein
LAKIGLTSYFPFTKIRPKAYDKNNSTCPNDLTATNRKVQKLAAELESNKHSKGIDSWMYLVTLLFCHLSNTASCKDISNGFMLVAAMNPCPWGFFNHPEKTCVCGPGVIQKYLNRISGPLLDRIDLHVEFTPVSFDELSSTVSQVNEVGPYDYAWKKPVKFSETDLTIEKECTAMPKCRSQNLKRIANLTKVERIYSKWP